MSEAILWVSDLYPIFPWSLDLCEWRSVVSNPFLSMKSLLPKPRFDFPHWPGA